MTSVPPSNVVVDYAATKLAALFFDHVVPLDGIEGVSGVSRLLEVGEDPDKLLPQLECGEEIDFAKAEKIIHQLLPPDFGSAEKVADFASVAARGVTGLVIATGFYNCDEVDRRADRDWAMLHSPENSSRYIGKVPANLNAAFVEPDSASSLGPEHALVSISKIAIPDTSQLEWDAIIEMRKDSQSRTRLRRLRVFAEREYAGKTRDFIEDDISVRLDDYEQTLKDWGVKTTLGALSTCWNVESALSAGVASLVATMSGLSGPEALGAALALPCSRFAIELATVRLARNEAVRAFPLAYLGDLKKLSS